ncbi:MAG: FHA domain-containing protein [Myxococcota bacterium]
MTVPPDDITETFDARPNEAHRAWQVTIVAHPDLTKVGRQAEVSTDAPVRLGRNSEALGPGVLDHTHISRDHARLEVNGRGELTVIDRGSRNGTFVGGARVEGQQLLGSSLLSVGRIVLWTEPARPPEPVSGRVLDTATALVDRGRPVHLIGESGAGKRWTAAALHHSRCHGPHERVEVQPDTPLALPPPQSLRTGSLVVCRLDRANDAQAKQLVDLLDASDADRPGVLLFTSRTPPPPLSKPGPSFTTLRGRLAPFSVELPPLRLHVSHAARLLALFMRRYAGPEAQVDPALVIRLLQHSWPGNVRELEAIVERAAVEARATGIIGSFPELDAILQAPIQPRLISTHGETMSSAPFVVARDGAWFRCPDGTTHDLASRKVLARVLAKLIAAHEKRPGDRVTVKELLAAAWPDERLMPKAGANRVYVALTNLRKLGLRELVARGDGGYSISPDAPLRIDDR